MDDTQFVALVGLAGTLAGVWLGQRLAGRAVQRWRIQDAAEQVIQVAVEGLGQFEAIEMWRTGGPPAPPLRPDLAKDAFAPMARLGLAPGPVARAAEDLTGAIRDAALAQMSADAGERKAGRQAAADALNRFREAAHGYLARPWWYWLRHPRS